MDIWGMGEEWDLLRVAQELRIIREVMDVFEGHDADDDGEETLEDEDPSPTWLVADAIHVGDGSCKQSAERTGDCGGGEEDSHTDTELGAPIPTRKIVSNTWK